MTENAFNTESMERTTADPQELLQGADSVQYRNRLFSPEQIHPAAAQAHAEKIKEASERIAEIPSFKAFDDITGTHFDKNGLYIGGKAKKGTKIVFDLDTGRKYLAPEDYGPEHLRYGIAKAQGAFTPEEWWGMEHDPDFGRHSAPWELAKRAFWGFAKLTDIGLRFGNDGTDAGLKLGPVTLFDGNGAGGQLYGAALAALREAKAPETAPELEGFYRRVSEWAKRKDEARRQALQLFDDSMMIHGLPGYIGEVIGSTAGSLLTAAAVGSVGGLPAVAAVFGSMQFHDLRAEYLEKKNPDGTPKYTIEEANRYAFEGGLKEGLVEMLGFKFFRRWATLNNSFRNWVLASVPEGLQEALQSIAEAELTTATGLRNEAIYGDDEKAKAEAWKSILLDIAISAAAGGIVGFGGAMLTKSTEIRRDKFEYELEKRRKEQQRLEYKDSSAREIPNPNVVNSGDAGKTGGTEKPSQKIPNHYPIKPEEAEQAVQNSEAQPETEEKAAGEVSAENVSEENKTAAEEEKETDKKKSALPFAAAISDEDRAAWERAEQNKGSDPLHDMAKAIAADYKFHDEDGIIAAYAVARRLAENGHAADLVFEGLNRQLIAFKNQLASGEAKAATEKAAEQIKYYLSPESVKDFKGNLKKQLKDGGFEEHEAERGAEGISRIYAWLSNAFGMDIAELRPLNLKAGQDTGSGRAAISLDDKIAEIIFGKNSDLSSVFHEFMHYFTDVIDRAAAQGNAKAAELKKEIDRIASGYNKRHTNISGQTSDEQKLRMEAVAEAFEMWLYEGRKEGQDTEADRLFKEIQDFFRKIYDCLKSISGVRLDPDADAFFRKICGLDDIALTEYMRKAEQQGQAEEQPGSETADRPEIQPVQKDFEEKRELPGTYILKEQDGTYSLKGSYYIGSYYKSGRIKEARGWEEVRESGTIATGFRTREEAENFASRLAEMQEPLPQSDGAKADRTGLPRRPKHSQTGQALLEGLGFKSVKTGRDLTKKDENRLMNALYDGVHDLAEILNIPPESLSLNGTLTVKLGAPKTDIKPGQGAYYRAKDKTIIMDSEAGSGRFAAAWYAAFADYMKSPDIRPEMAEAFKDLAKAIHSRELTDEEVNKEYEARLQELADKQTEILENIRKTNSAELVSLADEVMEADYLDAYPIPMEDLFEEKHETREYGADNRIIDEALKYGGEQGAMLISDLVALHNQVIDLENMDFRAELGTDSSRFARDYATAIGKSTQDTKDADVSAAEKDAAAFASYIHYWLGERGGRNTFLTRPEGGKTFNVRRAVAERVNPEAKPGETGDPFAYPYPMGREREAIFRAFDNVFSTLKYETTESGKVRLYQAPLIEYLRHQPYNKVPVVVLKNPKQQTSIKKILKALIKKNKEDKTLGNFVLKFVSHIRRNGAKNMSIFGHIKGGSFVNRKSVYRPLFVRNIEQLIENSFLVEIDNAKSEKIDHDLYYRFYVAVTVQNDKEQKVYPVRISVLHRKDNPELLTGDVYDLIDEEPVFVNKERHQPPDSQSINNGPEVAAEVPLEISILDLLAKVKGIDKQEYLNDFDLYQKTESGYIQIPKDVISETDIKRVKNKSGNNNGQTLYQSAKNNQSEKRYNKNEGKGNGTETYEATDDFRRIQEESNRLTENEISEFHRNIKELGNDTRSRLATVYGRLLSRNSGSGYNFRANLKSAKYQTEFSTGSVHPKLFHDIFEINRKYLQNGDLVDLHEDYSDCKCFITSDGLAGFAIEPDGNLVSVFSLNTKRGFLYAIKDFIVKEGANKLDCFISQKQDLRGIYTKTLGFKAASILDFNYEVLAESKGKEYADNFVKTHGEAQVAFMVLSGREVPERHFAKDQYSNAKSYQISQADKTDQEEKKNILQQAKKRKAQDRALIANDMKAQKEGSKAADKPDHAQLMKEFELVRRNGRPEAEEETFLSKTAADIGNAAADAILSVRQRAGAISRRFKYMFDRLDFTENEFSRAFGEKAFPFVKKYRELKDNDRAGLDFLLLNGMHGEAAKFCESLGMGEEYKNLRHTLDEIHALGTASGIDMGFIEDYFPTKVRDYEGLITYLKGTDKWTFIELALERLDPKGTMTPEERAEAVNKMLRGYDPLDPRKKPDNAKERKIFHKHPNLMKFYEPSDIALLRYMGGMAHAIAINKAFHVSDVFRASETVGAIADEAIKAGLITRKEEGLFKKLLKDRITYANTPRFISMFKNFGYLGTMNNFTSAITQLGDLYAPLYMFGTDKAIKGIFGKKEVTVRDLGLETVWEELRSPGADGIAVKKVFDIVGLSKLDRFGKENMINAALADLREKAASPDMEFMADLADAFGGRAGEVLADIRAGNVTLDVKMLLWNRLADTQPIGISGMPSWYLKNGATRLFYQLKTYTLTQLSLYWADGVLKMRRGLAAGNKKLFMQGAGNFCRLLLLLTAFNAGADLIKNLLMGRKVSVSDTFVANLIWNIGVSKYAFYRGQREGYIRALIENYLPPQISMADDASKEAVKVIQGKSDISETGLVQLFPYGRAYYWWFGDGREAERKKDKKAGREGRPWVGW